MGRIDIVFSCVAATPAAVWPNLTAPPCDDGPHRSHAAARRLTTEPRRPTLDVSEAKRTQTGKLRPLMTAPGQAETATRCLDVRGCKRTQAARAGRRPETYDRRPSSRVRCHRV